MTADPTLFTEPTGQNVQAVRDAIQAMRDGSGTYEDLKAAVQTAKFAPRPTATTLDDALLNWDYIPFPDTFNDTVQAAMFAKIITQEQMEELLALAQFASEEEPG